MLEAPSARVVNAISDPSGDHAGASSSDGPVVRRCCPVPSARITQTCVCLAERTNAIRFPSGDQAGSAASGPHVRRCRSLPSAPMR